VDEPFGARTGIEDPVAQFDFDWRPSTSIRIFDCALIGVAMVWAMLRLWRARRDARVETLFLGACCVLSCGGIAAAFLISNVVPNFNVGRYVANWFFLLPVLLVCVGYAGSTKPSLAEIAIGIGWCALFVVAGLAALPGQLTTLPPDIATPEERALVRFLDENGLTYGYAPFWSTNASVASWLSEGRIVIRPVSKSSAGRIVPRIPQTFPSWFEASDVPPGQNRFFLIAAPDGELCPDNAACEALARHDFGLPSEVLHFQGIPVLVWEHPLLTGRPDDDLIAAAPVLQPEVPVSFNRGGAGLPMLWRGWSGAEDKGTWSEGRQAVVLIHLPDDWKGGASLDFTASGFAARGFGKQQVTASVAGKTLASWRSSTQGASFWIEVPAEIAERKRFPLVLDMPYAGRPSDIRYIFDIRSLGIFLESLQLRHSR
jgi:hypothetical protein